MKTNIKNVLLNVEWFEINYFVGILSKKGYVFRSQTSNYKRGTDWLKRWVEAIYVEKCFVIVQYM